MTEEYVAYRAQSGVSRSQALKEIQQNSIEAWLFGAVGIPAVGVGAIVLPEVGVTAGVAVKAGVWGAVSQVGVSEAITAITQKRFLNPEEVAENVAVGTVLGIGTAGAIGGLGKLWGVLPESFTEPVEKAVYSAKLWGIENLPAWRGSDLDIWLAQHWDWYYARTGGIAAGEVVVPEGGKLLEWWGTDIGLKEVSAPEAAFEMSLAPRTGGVWTGGFGPAPEEASKLLLPRTMIVGGEIIFWKRLEPPEAGPTQIFEGEANEPTWFNRSPWRMETVTPTYFERAIYPTPEDLMERGLLPFVTQSQVTRMGIIPYVPEVSSSALERSFGNVALGISLSSLSTLLRGPRTPQRPKRAGTSFTLERIMYRPFSFSKPLKKARINESPMAIPISIPNLTPSSSQRQSQSPNLDIAQVPKQVSQQTPTFNYPFPSPTQEPSLKFFQQSVLQLTRRGRKAEKDLFGRWFKRTHPIKSPLEMLQTFGFSSKETSPKALLRSLETPIRTARTRTRTRTRTRNERSPSPDKIFKSSLARIEREVKAW
jgi:hypothetical protein